MSTPQESLQNDLKAAMKARDAERLSTLRMLLTSVKNERITKGAELDESDFLGIVRRLIKQRRDSATQYRAGGREELATKEESEIVILETYLPAQADEAAVRRAIEELVAAEQLEGPKSIGVVMKEMMKKFGAAADGGTINRIARDVLGL